MAIILAESTDWLPVPEAVPETDVEPIAWAVVPAAEADGDDDVVVTAVVVFC
jgi:hypothetical protein